MIDNRLIDYLDHMRQAVSDACSFIEGMSKHQFFTDKRTQQAVILSLIVIGEAATKLMDQQYKQLCRNCWTNCAKFKTQNTKSFHPYLHSNHAAYN